MTRTTELLEAAAEAFENSSDPFNTEWLRKHRVTADECFNLSQNIANACKNWARLDGESLMEGVIRASVDDATERDHLLAHARLRNSMERTVKELGKLAASK